MPTVALSSTYTFNRDQIVFFQLLFDAEIWEDFPVPKVKQYWLTSQIFPSSLAVYFSVSSAWVILVVLLASHFTTCNADSRVLPGYKEPLGLEINLSAQGPQWSRGPPEVSEGFCQLTAQVYHKVSLFLQGNHLVLSLCSFQFGLANL